MIGSEEEEWLEKIPPHVMKTSPQWYSFFSWRYRLSLPSILLHPKAYRTPELAEVIAVDVKISKMDFLSILQKLPMPTIVWLCAEWIDDGSLGMVWFCGGSLRMVWFGGGLLGMVWFLVDFVVFSKVSVAHGSVYRWVNTVELEGKCR